MVFRIGSIIPWLTNFNYKVLSGVFFFFFPVNCQIRVKILVRVIPGISFVSNFGMLQEITYSLSTHNLKVLWTLAITDAWLAIWEGNCVPNYSLFLPLNNSVFIYNRTISQDKLLSEITKLSETTIGVLYDHSVLCPFQALTLGILTPDFWKKFYS